MGVSVEELSLEESPDGKALTLKRRRRPVRREEPLPPALGTVLGVLVALPFTALGIATLVYLRLDADAPVWLLSYALMFLAAGLTALGILPYTTGRSAPADPRRRQRTRLAEALARLGFFAVPLNFAMGPYMILLAEATRAPPTVTLALILGANAALAAAVAWHALRTWPTDGLPIPERQLLRLHARTLDRSVRCPYCATLLEARGAVACMDCETMHHEDCWRENGGCTIYACRARQAVTLTGSEVPPEATA